MSIDLKSALTYPFQESNWKRIILWPGLGMFGFMFVLMTIMIITVFALGITAAIVDPSSNSVPFMMFPIIGLILLIELAGFSLLLGYKWHLIGNWQQNGLEAPAPGWQGNLVTYFVDGLKLWTYYLSLALTIGVFILPFGLGFILLTQNNEAADLIIPVVMLGGYLLLGLSAFLLSPFFLAPVIQSAQSRTLADLFNISHALELGRGAYGQALIANLLFFAMSLIMMVVELVVHFITCGFGNIFIQPLVLMPMMVIQWHLITQAFQEHQTSNGPDQARPFL